MNLPQTLLNEFAKITNDATLTANTEKTVYGTYILDAGGKAFVRIDGSESPTPVANAMDAQSGDRVTVMVKNHQATVTGNLTSPASARTATSYMKFTDTGLVVGGIGSDGTPSGPYVVIGSTSFTVYNASGVALATFGANGWSLKNANNVELASFTASLAKITTGSYQIVNTAGTVLAEFSASKASIASGAGIMQVFNDILFLIGETVGIRSSYTSGSTIYYSEFVARTGSTSPIASLQVRNNASTPVVSSVIASMTGVHVTTPSGTTMYVNNAPVLLPNQILATGSQGVSGTLKGNTRYDFAVTVSNIPSGYILAGVRTINVTDDTYTPRTWFKLLRFVTNPSTNRITATVLNSESTAKAIRVTFEWFAIRNSGSTVVPSPEVIDLGEIGD